MRPGVVSTLAGLEPSLRLGLANGNVDGRVVPR